MAEHSKAPTTTAPVRPNPKWWQIGDLFMPYRVLLGSRISSQASYRGMFWVQILAMFVLMATEIAEVLVYFHNTPLLGGMTLTGMLILVGLSGASRALADLTFGHVDELAHFVRKGTLESMYVRPLSVFGQVVTSEFQLRRLGRMVASLVILIYGLWKSGQSFTVGDFGLIFLAVVCGTVIFCAMFVMAGSLQFFVINAAESVNVVTYASHYVSQLPTSIFPRPMQWVYILVLPVVFVGYLPTLEVLGETSLVWVPAWGAWFAPVAAASSMLLAAMLWRLGITRYEGAGG